MSQPDTKEAAEKAAKIAKARQAIPPELPPAPAGDKPPEAPVADASSPVPRVIGQTERAPTGLKRYKFRCDNYQKEPLYLLAKDAESAKAEYSKATGLAAELARLERDGVKPVTPIFAMTELPD